jgi:hypothetical protein
MTKAQEIHAEVTTLVDEGRSKPDAFRQVAKARGIAYDSVRGAFYGANRKPSGSGSRTRRRETTTEDALADARKALQRSIENIDREVETAAQRAAEAQAEAEALTASAEERKQAIRERLEALK